MKYLRYSYPPIDAIWEEENQLKLWLKVELAFCQALAEFKKIPEESWSRIQRVASVNGEEVRKLEEETRHDIVAFLRAIENNLGADFQYFHSGLTSQDVKDTAFSLQLKEAGQLIMHELEELISCLSPKAEEYKRTIMMGRTHGMYAEPITFGLKLLRFKKEFERNALRLKRAIAEVAVGKFAGPVGTFDHIDMKVAQRACEILDLQCLSCVSQIIPRDIYALFFSILALLAANVEEVATEIRHLQRTEIGEALEPFGQGQVGSSAMPHKRNPILAERLCGLSRVIRFNVAATIENIPSWHERDISHSSVERIVAPLVTGLMGYLLQTLNYMIKHLEIRPERMRENMKMAYDTHFSQTLMLALVRKGIARSRASKLVQELAFRAMKEKISLRRLARTDERVSSQLSLNELNRIFSSRSLFSRIEQIFKLETRGH